MEAREFKFEKTDHMLMATVEYEYMGEHIITTDYFPVSEEIFENYHTCIEENESVKDADFETEIMLLYTLDMNVDEEWPNFYRCDVEDPNLIDRIKEDYIGKRYTYEDVDTKNDEGWFCHTFVMAYEDTYVRHYSVMVQVDEDNKVVDMSDCMAQAEVKGERVMIVPDEYDLNDDFGYLCID